MYPGLTVQRGHANSLALPCGQWAWQGLVSEPHGSLTDHWVRLSGGTARALMWEGVGEETHRLDFLVLQRTAFQEIITAFGSGMEMHMPFSWLRNCLSPWSSCGAEEFGEWKEGGLWFEVGGAAFDWGDMEVRVLCPGNGLDSCPWFTCQKYCDSRKSLKISKFRCPGSQTMAHSPISSYYTGLRGDHRRS